ncbi:MAG: pyridoxal-phosphate dependent enzyme [Deltaproteobacteria bacterium]|nr:pyridoxal-phosphate dependent enzyme [Deltaproteobacteria bacterium]
MSNMTSVLDLIGNTPVLKLSRLDTGACELFLKLECQNPGGSIKDRVALSMITAAEKAGRIKPGATLVEATAGNTGLGLALVAAQKGYRLVLVIPDKMSSEKILHLRALGAEIVLTRSDVEKGHPDYYQDMAARIARETPGALYIDQFNNPANTEAHEKGTAPELWEQLGHKVDAIVCGVGSGGTLSGLSRYFEKVSPSTELVLADPKGSILADIIAGKTPPPAGSWLVEGVGEDFVPSIADLSRVRKAYTISDAESFATARELLLKEGVLGGSSTGTLVAAALKYCRESKKPKRVVTFAVDSGNKYLSKMYNDYWLADQGFGERKELGDLRDLVTRPFSERAVATVKSDDRLLTAHGRMRVGEFSQLPVMENGKVIGLIDESDVLMAVRSNPDNFRQPVKGFMARNLLKVDAKTPIEELQRILDSGLVGMLYNGEDFYGLITRTDLLNYLRRKLT